MRHLLCCLLLLAGCAPGGGAVPNILAGSGQLRAHIDPVNDRRLVVEVTGTRDIGWDMDIKADRHTTLLAAFAPQCGTPSIVSERVTQIGAGVIKGFEPRIYTVVLDCPNGASRPVP